MKENILVNTDAIERDIFQHQIVGIAEEMSVALRRTAYSSIIWDMYDYACGIFNSNIEMISQSETIPGQLGIMPLALKHMTESIPMETWKQGDILICNDPYRGCTHTMDVVLFCPIFNEGELIAVSSTVAHHIDIGGKNPGSEGPDSRDVFAEGLIIPPSKLFFEGSPNQTIFDILASNVRQPEASSGDLRSQLSSCRTGELRILELAKKYGNKKFSKLSQLCIYYNEKYIRRAISKVKNGFYEASIFMEDEVSSKNLVRIHSAIEVRDEELYVDLSESDDQRPNGLNCPLASTHSMVNFAVKCIFAPDLNQNHGCDKPVKIKTRHGSILDPKRPAAVSVRQLAQQGVADLILKCLAPIGEKNSAAACQISLPTFTWGGLDDRPNKVKEIGFAPYYIISDIIGGGMGGGPNSDGLSAVDTHSGNCAILSAEILETLSPVRVLKTCLVKGSGGAGQYRGGLGIMRDYEILASNLVMTGYCQQTCTETFPWGFNGGSSGKGAMLIKNPGTDREQNLGSKFDGLLFEQGDVLRVISAGGGGWGDPLLRSQELIAIDKKENYS